MDRLLRLDALWRVLSRKGAPIDPHGSNSGAAVAALMGILDVRKQSIQIKSLRILDIPLALYQLVDSLRIRDVILSNLHGLETLNLAMFLRLIDLKTLSVNGCPDLQLVVLTSPTSSHAASVSELAKLEKLDFCMNPSLARLPLTEILAIESLTALECRGCPKLASPPQEVAKQGGAATLTFVREANRDGEANSALTLEGPDSLGFGAGAVAVEEPAGNMSVVVRRVQREMQDSGLVELLLREVAVGVGRAWLSLLVHKGLSRLRVLDLRYCNSLCYHCGKYHDGRVLTVGLYWRFSLRSDADPCAMPALQAQGAAWQCARTTYHTRTRTMSGQWLEHFQRFCSLL